jgi:hypothetical protein
MSPLTISRPLARSPKDQPMHPTISIASAAGSAGGSCRRRAANALTALAAAAAALLSLTAAPALADDCPNAGLRAQNNSTQLPDCRAYELVTPVFKEGFSPVLSGITDAGRLTFLANGNFANNGMAAAGLPGGNTYLAEREESGWAIKGLPPHGPEYYTDTSISPFAAAVSSDLGSSLWLMRRGDQTNVVSDLYIRRSDDTFTRIGSGLDTLDHVGGRTHRASDDLSHIAFIVGDAAAYEYFGPDHAHMRRVDVDNADQPLTAACEAPRMGAQFGSAHHVISTDGRVIFVQCNDDGGAVFARVNGTTTINVAGSQCTRGPSDPGGECTSHSRATFEGASADGTRAYFTTGDQLVDGDTDDTNDLYECDIPTGTPVPVGSVNQCPDLREVSGAAEGADVQGVTRLSEDGSRAYFVAKGVLASNTDANGVPATTGDDNLYVWTRDAAHPDGETRFLAKLDVADGAGANGLWNSDWTGRLAQATDDGRYLVFGSYAPLIDHGAQADTDSARDIYRYDAQTGAMTRLSINVDGHGGNEPGANANFTISSEASDKATKRTPRTAMSDDGESVVFNTTDALAPSDTNGTVDVYLWQEGRVSLISSGKPSDDQAVHAFTNQPLGATAGGISLALISPSGHDVYFETTARMVSTDVDTVFDIYDARVDGGFDLSTSPTCSGDACQSPPSAPLPPSQTGSTSSTGQAGPSQTTPAFTVAKLTASQLKQVVSTGKVLLSVTTNAPGVLSVQATATLAQRPRIVGSAKRAVAKAGTLSLSLTLTKKARAELKSKRKLTVKVLVSQNNVAIARTVSLKLTQPKAAKKKTKNSSRTTSRHAASKGGRS